MTPQIALRDLVQYHPLTMSLLWRSAARADQCARDPRVVHLRFEDLVADPPRAIEPLLTAMSLEFELPMLAVTRAGSSNRPGVRAQKGFDPEVIGRWRGGLSTSEQWINNRVCGQLMARYGYVAEPARPTALGLLRAAVSLPLRTLVTVLLNLGRSGSVLESVRRRL